MKKAIVLFFIGVFVIFLNTSKNSTQLQITEDNIPEMDPEQRLDLIAQTKLAQLDLVQGRTFSVSINKGIYHIDVNGKEVLIKIEDPGSFPKTTKKQIVGECQEDSVLEVIESSKRLVLQYIEESTVLENKRKLQEYIDKVPVAMARYEPSNEETVAEYDFDEKIIFINQDYKDVICEWLLVHEYIHALANKTNEGKKNMRYPYQLFNEVMTDVITCDLQPQIASDIVSAYDRYYENIYLYMGAVGTKDAIHAYYYGYEELLKKINENELDIFANLIGEQEGDAPIVVNNCINNWALAR